MQSTTGGPPNCSVEFLPPATGKPTITATYGGDSAHDPSIGTSTVLITGLGSGQLVMLGMNPTSFVAASSDGSIAKAKKVGTKVTYTLRAPARVRFTVQRPTTGRRGKGGRCAAPTAKNRKHAKCTRWVTLKGSVTLTGVKGKNKVPVPGPDRREDAQTGRYRLVATPSIQGVKGKATTRKFKIKRR